MPGLPKRLARYAHEFLLAGQDCQVDPYLLAAICDRESLGGTAKQLDVVGPSGRGDHGHGHGLMQIDDRAHGEWLAAHAWQEPLVNIAKGAEILRAAIRYFKGDEFAGVAAYNCGPKRVKKAIRAASGKSRDIIEKCIDACTTGGDYATDVLSRRARFRSPPPVA